MRRRSVLRNSGAVGVALLAGCVGGGSDEFTLKVSSTEIDQNEAGTLIFKVTVSNPGNDAQTGTLYVNSKLNGDSLVRVREVSLEAHQTTEVVIEYDIAYENVTSFSPKATIEPSS